MKAVRFFCLVFFSMLAVFLLATGEFKRWFARVETNPIQLVNIGKADWPTKNLINFDFYNVEMGRRSFTIRAEFSQDDLQVPSQIEKIEQLTLRDGWIEVPVAEVEDQLAPKDDGKESPVRNVVLQFKSALYHRGSESSEGGKGKFEVLLRDGKGTTNEGTEFFFEELTFFNESLKAGDKTESSFILNSTKPVSIKNASLELRSPSGFRASLRSRGLENFTFLPPVSAVLDPAQPSMLGLQGADAEDKQGKAGGDARKNLKIAASCQGPLSLLFEERRRETVPPTPAKTLIRFQKDVILYAVDPGATAVQLPPPEGSRLECQELELELESVESRLLPRRALATWEGGRVRIGVQKPGGGILYNIEGERLEWNVTRPLKPGEDVVSASQAVLHGKPTLRGQNVSFDSERAVFDLHENVVRLESVRGTVDHAAATPKPAKAAGKDESQRLQPPSLEPPSFEPIGDETATPAPAAAPRDRESGRTGLPKRWALKADEADFELSEVPTSVGGSSQKGTSRGEKALGGAAIPTGSRELSRVVARSKDPDGVEIVSLPPEKDSIPPAQTAESPLKVTGSLLTYVEAEKKLTIEGARGVKPRFTQEENWMEAQKIHILLEEGVGLFEEEVRGRIANMKSLQATAGAQAPGKEQTKAAVIPIAPEGEGGPKLDSASFDLEAASLAIFRRQDKEKNNLWELWGRGTREAPVQITSLSSPWCRFVSPEIYWDQERQAVLLTDESTQGPQPTPPRDPGQVARVEFENGELRSHRIQFDGRKWKAYLSDLVTIRIFEKGAGPAKPAWEIQTAKAEVEFFPGLKEEGADRFGVFQHLRRIKSLRAVRTPQQALEIRGTSFVGRAEEATWSSEKRELRFSGTGLQEIEILREDFKGPIYAREIVYDEAKNLVSLRGNVHGTIVQSSLSAGEGRRLTAVGIQPAAHVANRDRKTSRWRFDTSVLEIQLKQENGVSFFELVSVRARDKVYLRNEELRLQLRGDDLSYEEATRKIHVFSPDGRPQTLLCDRFGSLKDERPQEAADPATEKKPDPASEKLHKIVAQEIWILLLENPQQGVRRGEPPNWLLVQFVRDVMASFYLPPTTEAGKLKGMGDLWKMVAEKLTLHVDPTQASGAEGEEASRRLIPWAQASGKVVFSSGSFQATADRAIYEDPLSRVTLMGSPARLSQDNRTVQEEPEIQIRKAGDRLEYSVPGRQATPSPPSDVLELR